jgi:hypothetical protein
MTTEPEVVFKTKLNPRRPPSAPDAPPADEPAVGRPEFEDPTVALIVETNEMVVGLVEAQRQSFELKISRLETQIATLTGAVETLKAKSSRWPRGPAGPKGEAAARIVSWKVNSFSFSVTPIMSDGSAGGELELKPLLEALIRRLAAEAKP